MSDSPFTRTVEGVLFDMDGTLIDSTPAVIRCWIRLAEEEGFDPRFLENNHGTPAAQILEQVLPPERIPAALARIIELEETDLEGVVALPGAQELLDSLPADKHAIVTSCTRNLALRRLKQAGLRAPETIVTFDDVTLGKPHPEPFELGASLLGLDPRNCIVFEDAPAGLAAGAAAGCTTIAIAGTHPGEHLEADAVIGDLSQVAVTLNDGSITLTVQ
ncbi:HAD-IA family hydrolase [Lysinibacter cavernae]|uniref:HAD-IA family hydrolase n=1 Tax=Lysinibacter cavernae TaxID=1640652 RepID=UPI003132AB99